MLKLRPNCELCNTDLAPDESNAYICTFECTFCRQCCEEILHHACPNCGGNLVERPARTPAMLEKYPASVERVLKK